MAQKNKTKIYFWLKLDENFYKNIIIKKARKTSDTMVIVYQRLMLQSLATNVYLYYEGAFENLAEELATSLDEDVEQVQMALAFFSKYGLIQFDNEQNANMLQVHALIDQETNWARYQRENRKKEKTEKLDIVQPLSNHCPTEIEKEIELEKEKEIEKEKKTETEELFSNYFSIFTTLSKKNLSRRAMALQVFITLSHEQKERSVIGANNYVEYYKSKNPGDNEAKFSINAYEFLSNMMFEEYQQKVKVKKETLGGLI
ncbi:phage replisome organizer protein [Lactococcus taiwanensis]|uniref:phage replisome organizer protein n=1 Tax=Lactococcus taiwanensis TaxID=1151742 RepID=UPI0028B1E06F|nr:phage replisome organiser protein [Lactococcus taiwanensis]